MKLSAWRTLPGPAGRAHARVQTRARGGLTALVLCVGSGALLSACGSGGTASAGTTTAAKLSAAASASGPKSTSTSPALRGLSRAQALAFAHAVNLQVSDIPEASRAPRLSVSSTARERAESRQCDRLVPHVHKLGEASSPRLKRGSELEVEEIASAVEVVSDPRAVAGEFAALRSSALRACGARVWTRYFSTKVIREAHWGRFTFSELPVSAPGASASFGIRISGALSLPFSEVSVPIYVDVLGFAIGPAEIALTASSVTQPIPAATEQELVTLLLTRAKAYAL